MYVFLIINVNVHPLNKLYTVWVPNKVELKLTETNFFIDFWSQSGVFKNFAPYKARFETVPLLGSQLNRLSHSFISLHCCLHSLTLLFVLVMFAVEPCFVASPFPVSPRGGKWACAFLTDAAANRVLRDIRHDSQS